MYFLNVWSIYLKPKSIYPTGAMIESRLLVYTSQWQIQEDRNNDQTFIGFIRDV